MISITRTPDGQIDLNRREQAFLFLSAVFFASLPARVFIAISGDVIQVAAITVPFVVAFMTIVLTMDITFNLPIPEGSVERLADRHNNFSKKLLELLQLTLSLITITLVAKSLAIWFCDWSWPWLVIIRLAAFAVGSFVALLIIRIRCVRDIFGYLSVGADIALRVRASRRGG